MAKVGHRAGSRGFSSPTYNTWCTMKQRCSNPNHHAFSRYGGKGIKVCERWHKFANFLADMGERPADKTLDRINGEGDYAPDNCRWATWEEQQANKDWAIKVGDKMLIRLCEEHGIAYGTVWRRIKSYGWTVERALTTPSRRRPRQQASSSGA